MDELGGFIFCVCHDILYMFWCKRNNISSRVLGACPLLGFWKMRYYYQTSLSIPKKKWTKKSIFWHYFTLANEPAWTIFDMWTSDMLTMDFFGPGPKKSMLDIFHSLTRDLSPWGVERSNSIRVYEESIHHQI